MLSKAETHLLHALKTRSGREKNQAFVVEGVRVLEDLLAAGHDLQFVAVSPAVRDSARGRALIEQLQARTTIREMSDGELRALSETETPQGIIAVARIEPMPLAKLQLNADALVLVLDAVQDPGNLGTLVRSADAFGADAVIALPGTVDYWNPKVVRAAAGATFHLPLVNAGEADVWGWLETNGFMICGADMSGEDVRGVDTGGRIALVVGNEGGGLRKDTRPRITRTVSIPMAGRAESLNVAVAAGILLYELSRTNR